MKKGQATTFVIILVLVVIAIALIVIVINSSNKPSTSGNIFKETTKEQETTGRIIIQDNKCVIWGGVQPTVIEKYCNKASDCYASANAIGIYDTDKISCSGVKEEKDKGLVGGCSVNSPFVCDDFSVKTSGIILELKNMNKETLIIKKVTVSNCGSEEITTGTSEKGIIYGNNLNQFSIPCLLVEGSTYRGNIKIEYFNPQNDEILISEGTIQGFVNG